jgi:GDP-4-dehydro-6-deoxy-D-mannose reductase
MKKVLITGITGFVGQHLAKHFLSQSDYEVVGTYRSEASLDSLQDLKEHVSFLQLDLMDPKAVSELLLTEKPDYICHLAAQASPAISFKNPSETLTNNIVAELNVLEALRSEELKGTRILIVSTGEVYGAVTPADLPVDELTPMRPVSPYSVSKIAQDYLALQYFLAYHVDIVRVRPFNHTGPGQKAGYVVSDFARQIVAIEQKKNDPIIFVGNLEAKRDFTDVRDVVRAYQLALEKGVSGEVYNIGSGTSRKIADILETLRSHSQQEIEVKTDPSRFRPIDVPEIVCDYQKFQELTGWKPEIPFEKTLQDILDYLRKIV